MVPESIGYPVRFALLGVLIAAASTFPAKAEDAETLWIFNHGGFSPQAGLTVDLQGNLFGTTNDGGASHCGSVPVGCGTVYELSPPTGGGTNWTYTVLHAFHGDRGGGLPRAELTIDGNGAVYGYTDYRAYGNVFRLLPPAQGQTAWTFQNLYTFANPARGSLAYTYAPLVVSNGQVYGIAGVGGRPGCGQYGCGTLFQLTPGENGGPWTEKTLLRFSGRGAIGFPSWMVGPDSGGALYISTDQGNGAVIRYVPGAAHASVVASFRGGNNGSYPSSLVHGPSDTIYGLATTRHGSLVFRLTPPNGGNTKWERATIAIIKEHGGFGTLSPGPGGTLLGTNFGDYDIYAGNAIQLTPPAGGTGLWTYTELRAFSRGPNRNPYDIEAGRGAYASDMFGVLDGNDGSIYELCPAKCN